MVLQTSSYSAVIFYRSNACCTTTATSGISNRLILYCNPLKEMISLNIYIYIFKDLLQQNCMCIKSLQSRNTANSI